MDDLELPLADELAALAARMSELMLSEVTVSSALEILTALAVTAIDAASGAGITLIDAGGDKTSAASTSDVVMEADALQYALGEGPCLTAWAERTTVRIDDVFSDPRFPQWNAAVRGLGLTSCLSTPLAVGDRSLGAVKVYSPRRSAFDERSQRLLEGFARTAALMLANLRSLDNAQEISAPLREALKSRDLVQLAKGVVMARDGLAEDEAFQLLVTDARGSDRDLRHVAQETIEMISPRSA